MTTTPPRMTVGQLRAALEAIKDVPPPARDALYRVIELATFAETVAEPGISPSVPTKVIRGTLTDALQQPWLSGNHPLFKTDAWAYLVVDANGLSRVSLDEKRADTYAQAIEGAVVALPVTADYRPKGAAVSGDEPPRAGGGDPVDRELRVLKMNLAEDAFERHANKLQWYVDQGGDDQQKLAGILGLHYPILLVGDAPGEDQLICHECRKPWECPTYKVIRWGP
jgi:hypothetical protein